MSDVTELRCWPCVTCAIDWSQDGIIALASEDQVELLFPNTETYDSEIDTTQWKHFPIQVPGFTEKELPLREPGPLEVFSVGEEISNSIPITLLWSPPGLAKHKRCALGVLTSNLVLSIWAPEGKVEDETSWSRRLIINDTLATYFETTTGEQDSHITSNPANQLMLRKRVRAFAWSPPLPCTTSSGIVGTQLSWGQHMVAIANDDNHVIFLAVNSPTSSFGPDDKWSADVLGHFSVTPHEDNIIADPFNLDDLLQQQRHISHIAWGPWIEDEKSLYSVVAYATNDDVRGIVVTYNDGELAFREEFVYADISMRYNGPMIWCPGLSADGKLTLALFSNTGLICLTVSKDDASLDSKASHDLDGRWDPTSGAAFDLSREIPRLHFSSHTSTTRYPTSAVKVTPNKLHGTEEPYWRSQIDESEVYYSMLHDLNGNAQAKVWGLATSALRDHIASCYTIHPTDMIEYGIPAERWCTVAVNNLRPAHDELVFPKTHVTAEGLAFSIRKWVDWNLEDEKDMPKIKQRILDNLFAAYGPVNRHNNTTGHNEGPYSKELIMEGEAAAIKSFKFHAFLSPDTLKDRYSFLFDTICTSNPSIDADATYAAKTMIALRLCEQVHKLSTVSETSGSLDEEILKYNDVTVRYISAISGMDREEANEAGAAEEDVVIESCGFCDAPIPFDDLWSATCTAGHGYFRCGITFLAIQDTDMSKNCGICGTAYLSDDYVTEPDVEDEELDVRGQAEGAERTRKATLARIVFQACDVCIYCGGKFVGPEDMKSDC
ncbi:hypothetical protein P154DRAFT_4061 [Amniculicola lignicola CBS 123094]|uniref:Transcription factor IIIC putative zinc-finger domain-containing protein n=1 Tax=Amniculicola lignicola CBS 123094 TaxID=1392246 RepID=A0A6A5X4L3_9PLEO|nr:hypothetical protein P154DRAFT_4061 [Amniculicola lignicola CBS 123094]